MSHLGSAKSDFIDVGFGEVLMRVHGDPSEEDNFGHGTATEPGTGVFGNERALPARKGEAILKNILIT